MIFLVKFSDFFELPGDLQSDCTKGKRWKRSRDKSRPGICKVALGEKNMWKEKKNWCCPQEMVHIYIYIYVLLILLLLLLLLLLLMLLLSYHMYIYIYTYIHMYIYIYNMYVHKCWTFRIYIHLLYFTSVFYGMFREPPKQGLRFSRFSKASDRLSILRWPAFQGQQSWTLRRDPHPTRAQVTPSDDLDLLLQCSLHCTWGWGRSFWIPSSISVQPIVVTW